MNRHYVFRNDIGSIEVNWPEPPAMGAPPVKPAHVDDDQTLAESELYTAMARCLLQERRKSQE